MSLAAEFTHQVGRMPFVGRHFIRATVNGALRERYTRPKLTKTAGALALMGAMLAIHIQQTKMGVQELLYDTQQLADGDFGVWRQAQIITDALFGSGNAVITAAQTFIAYRVGKSMRRSLKHPRTAPFEVGIDITPGPDADGIDAQPSCRTLHGLKEIIRREGTTLTILNRDALITAGAQLAFVTTMQHNSS